MIQSGFFDLDNRHRKLDEKGPLIHLNQLIDWESFRPSLNTIRLKKKKTMQDLNTPVGAIVNSLTVTAYAPVWAMSERVGIMQW
jgi:hypothetical protein